MRKIGGLLFLLLFFPVLVPGFSGSWEAIGPDGGDFCMVTSNPSNALDLIAMTSSGTVYHSLNGGNSWIKRSQISSSYTTDACVYDYSILYAVSYSIGYRSVNGGQTWQTFYFPYEYGYPYRICAHPANDSIVYAAGINYDSNTSSYKFAFFKSIDGGTNWSGSNFFSFPYFYPEDITISKNNPNDIYICGIKNNGSIYCGALLKSNDGGATWSDISSSVSITEGNYFYCVEVDPNNFNRVYLGGNSFYYSPNSGASWVKESPTNIGAIGIDPTNTAKVYAAGLGCVFVSSNYGVDWTYRPGLKGSGSAINVAVNSPSTLYAGTGYGLYRSQNSGTSWGSIHTGIHESTVTAFSVCQSEPSVIFAEEPGYGVRATSNGGQIWRDCGYFVDCGSLCDILVHPTNPSIVYGLKYG